MNFAQWYKKVNAISENQIGLSLDELDDFCYLDMYEEGFTPSEAFQEIYGEQMGIL